MTLRKGISPFVRLVSRKTSKVKIVMDSYPKLKTKESYIFASTHGFNEDIEALVSSIDRNAYIVIGSNEQMKYNNSMKGAFINGVILVDLKDDYSRSMVVDKATRVLNYGTSVVIYPEGSWNTSENVLVKPLYKGIYDISQKSGKNVVPVASIKVGNTVYLKADNPIDLSSYSLEEGLIILRDKMFELKYLLIEKYSKPFIRSEYGDDPRFKWMEMNKNEVLSFQWRSEDWDIEYITHKPKNITTPEDVRKSLDDVQLTVENAKVLAKEKVERMRDEKYDYIKYLKRTWLDDDV